MDGERGFIAGFLVAVTLMLLLILTVSESEFTCAYFENSGYVTIADDGVCYLETETGFVPVEGLLK